MENPQILSQKTGLHKFTENCCLETADIALTHDIILKLPWLIRLSRRMLGIIKINIVFGLAFNAIAVVAGGMGWLTPIMAAIVHNVGSVIVVFTSASLAVFPEQTGGD